MLEVRELFNAIPMATTTNATTASNTATTTITPQDIPIHTYTSTNNYNNNTNIRNNNELRIITYNILAEYFATKPSSIHYLYPYCNIRYLGTEYRLQLIIKELLAYNISDIICIQECDYKLFIHYYNPLFISLGYNYNNYLNKSSNVLEGLYYIYALYYSIPYYTILLLYCTLYIHIQ